jgi:hypothetical protein
MKRINQHKREGMEGIEGIGSALSISDGNVPSLRVLGEIIPTVASIPSPRQRALPEIDPGTSKRRKTGGRQKGTPNKVTRDIRGALRHLAEGNADRVQEWLDRVADDDPAEAVRLWLALLRFVTPTLQAAAITDITPKRTSERLAMLSEDELLAIIHGGSKSVPALPGPDSGDPTDEEFLQ